MANSKRIVTNPVTGPPSPDARAAVEGRALINQGGGGGGNGSGNGHVAFDVYGISGLTRFGTISRIYEEFLRELQGPQGMKSYREMMDNDPITGAILFAANHLSRKVSFKFKPASDTQQARYIADKIGSMIFDDMESTWPDTLSEILTMLPFGWSLLEYRLKRRLGMSDLPAPPPAPGSYEIGAQGYPSPTFAPSRFDDGLIGFRSWSLRSQETLFMWEFDEDSNAVVMQQMAPPDYKIRRIPMSKALLFRTQVAKNSPEGRSIMRNGWTSYYMKKNLQVFEGIGVERDLAGYPVIQIAKPDPTNGLAVPDIWNPRSEDARTMLAALKQIVRSVRRDEQEGMVLPWWAEFKLLSGTGRRRVDTNAVIARYDQRIAMSVMADFIMLGHEAVGSKALASTKISLFTSALSSFLDNACSVISRRAVPLIMQFNGWPEELCPVLQHGDVESVNLQELGQFIGQVARTGFNPLASTDAQISIMETANLPTTGLVSDLGSRSANAKPPGRRLQHPGQQGEPMSGNQRSSGVGDASMGEGDSSGGGGPVAAPESPMGPMGHLSTS